MSITARFAFDAFVSAGLAIILWSACTGVGLLVVPRTTIASDDKASPRPGWWCVGVAAGAGLGVLMALAGVMVLLRLPLWLAVFPFVGAGLVLATRAAYQAIQVRPPDRRLMLLGGALLAAGCLVALIEAPVGLRFLLNSCDDFRAYMPMADRLLDTNGMEAAWSTRRLQSLGGVDVLRAISLAALGDRSGGMVDTVVASVFLAGLFVGNGARTTWARTLSIVLVLAIPFLFVPRVNTTGVLLAVPLLVAVIAATAGVRHAARAGDRAALVRWSVAGGLITAALMSVRPNHGALAAAILVLGSLIGRGLGLRPAVRATVAAGATAVLAVLPWSLAMWRTAGSLMYPPFGGNLSRDATRYAPLDGLGERIADAYDLLDVGPYLWTAIVVIVVAMLARRVLPDGGLVVIAAVAVIFVSAAFALSTPFAGWSAFIRYTAPASQALAVFLLCDMVRAVDASPSKTAESSPIRFASLASLAAALLIAAGAFSTFRIPSWSAPYGATLVQRAFANELQPDGSVTSPLITSIYDRAMRLAGEDGTIVAVDRPYLIDHSQYDVANMDLPGFMTGDGTEFPFFEGPSAKLAYLRDAGFETLVVSQPATDVCLAPVAVERALALRSIEGPRYVRYLDWGYDIDAIEREAPAAVRPVGGLRVIDILRARALMGAKGNQTDPRVNRARAELRGTGPV